VEALHHYDMSLKKNGLYVSLASDDMVFISRQMDKWFHILLDEKSRPPVLPLPQATAQTVPIAPPQVAQGPVAPSVAVAATPLAVKPEPAPESIAPPAQPEPVAAVVAPPPVAAVPEPQVGLPEPETKAIEPTTPVVELPVLDATLPAGPAITPQAVTPVEAEKIAVEEASEAIMAPPEPIPPSKPAGLPELDLKAVEVPPMPESIAPPETRAEAPDEPVVIPVAPPSIHERLAAHHAATSMAAPIASEVVPAMAQPIEPSEPIDDFDAIMNSVMQDLDAEELPETALGAEDSLPMESISSLSDLCNHSSAETMDELLLLAAYYLTTFEQQKAFTLKQLNSSLVKSGKSPVNHGVLEVALQEGVLDMVPDLNGTAEISEYRLTEQGDLAANKLLR